MDFGWGNGYVLIPPGHPAFGMDYDTVYDLYDIEVNGGLTFASHADKLTEWDIPEDSRDCWVLGFDTCHHRDTLLEWPKYRVKEEAERLARQLQTPKS